MFGFVLQLLRGEEITESEKVIVERIRPLNSRREASPLRSRTSSLTELPSNPCSLLSKHPILKPTTKWIMAANADRVIEDSQEVQVQPSLKMSNGTPTVTTVSSVMTSALPQTTSTLSQSISTPNITISQLNDSPKMSVSTSPVSSTVESNKNTEPMETENTTTRDMNEVQTFSSNKNTITIRSLPMSAPWEVQTASKVSSGITRTVQITTASAAVAATPGGPTAAAVPVLSSTGSAQSPAQVTMPVMYTNIQGNIVPVPTAPIVQVIVVNQCVKPNNGNTVVDSSKLTPIAPAPVFIQPQSGEVVSGVERNVEVMRRRTHVCPYENCEKTYFKSSHLKAHIRTHTGNFNTLLYLIVKALQVTLH